LQKNENDFPRVIIQGQGLAMVMHMEEFQFEKEDQNILLK
jgi:hypothetical protein